jgi:hypothetical protein
MVRANTVRCRRSSHPSAAAIRASDRSLALCRRQWPVVCAKGDLCPVPESLPSSRVSSYSIERRVCCLTTEPLARQVRDIEPWSTTRMLTLMTPPLRLSRRRCAATER